MDKRAITAIVLSFLVLLLWTLFIAPKPVPPPAAPLGASIPAAAGQPASSTADTTAGARPKGEGVQAADVASSLESAAGPRTAKREAPEGAPPAVIDTEFARIEIARQGAKVVSWTLKQHEDYEGRPYELVSPDSDRSGIYPLQFRFEDKVLEGLLNQRARFDLETTIAPGDGPESKGPGGAVPAAAPPPGSAGLGASAETRGTRSAALAPQAGTGSAHASPDATAPSSTRPAVSPGGQVVRLVYSDGRGLEAVKTFTIRKDSYLVEVEASVTRNGRPVSGELLWGPSIGTPSAEDLSNRYYYGGRAIADYPIGAKRFTARTLTTPTRLEDGLLWAGLEEQYFAVVFLPLKSASGIEIIPAVVSPASPVTPPPAGNGAKPPADDKPGLRLCIAVPIDQPYALFAGPKDYKLLTSLGQGLPELVNFAPGTPLIGPLIGALAKILWSVLRWLYSYIPNYGLGIIILTTTIKILFYPITQRAMVKMRGEQKKMQKVQPKVTAIKERSKKAKDAAGRTKMNEEIMALYKREGINPMASLGGCLPLVLQLPILYAFYSVLTVSIELRKAPFFGWIRDLSRQDPYYITPIVMGISMFAQQKLAMTKVTDPQQRAQQRMMMVMPLIFTFTFLHLPSGLVLYWFVNNLLGIVQQVLINRQALAIEASERAAATG